MTERPPDEKADRAVETGRGEDEDLSASSDEEYYSVSSESETEDTDEPGAGRDAREKERQRVLEAAGLIVKSDRKPPPRPPKFKKAKRGRRPPPAAPSRDSVVSNSSIKELTPPPELDPEPEPEDPNAQLNDAFARYEAFKFGREGNRLSFASSLDSFPQPSATPPPPQVERADSREQEGESSRHHLHFLGFLGRRTPANDDKRPNITISGPISGPVSAVSLSNASETSGQDSGPAFGSVSEPVGYGIC